LLLLSMAKSLHLDAQRVIPQVRVGGNGMRI
jgi:hypothetical protein